MSHDPIKRFWWFVYGAGLVCIALFGIYQARFIIGGPRITIDSPANGSIVNEQLVTLSGEAKNIKTLTVNGKTMYTSESGHFSERLLLFPGYNTIVVAAQDKFGTERKVQVELVVQLPDNTVSPVVTVAHDEHETYGKNVKKTEGSTEGDQE